MFFRKQKTQQEASVASVEKPVKEVTEFKVKKEPTLPPFHPSPRCPKCCSYGVTNAVYCRGKKFLRSRCEHKLRGEHIHRTCQCGYRWAHAVNTEATDSRDTPKGMSPVTTLADSMKCAKPKQNENPLAALGFGEDFLEEVKDLQSDASPKKKSPLLKAESRDDEDNCYRMKSLNKYQKLVLPEEVDQASPFFGKMMGKQKLKYSTERDLLPTYGKEAMYLELKVLAENLADRNYEGVKNNIASLNGYLNVF